MNVNLSEWNRRFKARVEKLNSAPAFQMFEVGPKGTLIGGDVTLSKGENDEFEATVMGLRPGIWTIKETDEGDDDFKEILIRWVAPGPLDFDNLPVNLPEPNFSPLTKWKRVASYSVDSGVHGVFDQDSLENLIASCGGIQHREFILEVIADFSLFDNYTSVQVGLVAGGGDGGYKLMAREYEGVKVEILLQRNWADDEDEKEGEGEDEDENDEDD
ncbi:unnamed protein product [Somion occarium]|uniref:Uncharacterized protein n=1 Tax=Somion occarium TaxID=3059160 RepID=A0ABP1CXB3_9APHY